MYKFCVAREGKNYYRMLLTFLAQPNFQREHTIFFPEVVFGRQTS